MVYNHNFLRVVQQVNLMRFFMLSLLLSAVLALSAGATPIFPRYPSSSDPVVTCPGDTLLLTEVFSCTVTFDYVVSATDDLPGVLLVQTQGLPSGSSFPIGATVNTYVATDSDGNTASCSFTVTVKDDVPPVAACSEYVQAFIGPYDDPNDCYDGYVTSIYALTVDEGSYDACGGNIKITIRRAAPYSSFIQSLNPINGHPDCSDSTPDAVSEYELATAEAETIKFYCEEAGTEQILIMRVYQLDASGNIDLDINGQPIFNDIYLWQAVVDPSVICEAPNLSAQLQGTVELDANGDCTPDANATGLPNMVVEAKTTGGQTVYTVTGTDGTYKLSDLPQGLTEVSVKPYLPIWDICNNQTSVNLPVAPSATQLDFNALPTLNCPLLTVDIAANAVLLCNTNTWPVSYSNKGNVIAQNATVEIKGKAPFTLVDADKTFTILGDVMTVQLGDIKPGETGHFNVRIQVPCDGALVGQNVCVEAAISPVSTCLPNTPNWKGAQIEAEAVCEADSIHFTLKNTGTAPTTQNLDFVIIDDMVVMHQGQIPSGLATGGEVHHTEPTQGHALRIQAAQEPGHPLAQAPSLSVENCNGVTSNSTLLEFHNEDGNPFTDQECHQIVASSNGSQLLAFPYGFGNEHFIEQNSRLTYQINFQNTGDDNVSVVVIRDNIPALLNPADIHMGASSHPYTWSLSGPGILEVRFEPIDLPTSTTNPAASHGFVQFDIAQKANNPIGSLIENQAQIFFDIQPSFQSNTTWHTVGEDFLGTSGLLNQAAFGGIEVYPNPASTQAFLQLEGTASVHVRLVNMFGQKVAEFRGNAPSITLERGKMSSGLYQIEVESAGNWIKSGKLIWN